MDALVKKEYLGNLRRLRNKYTNNDRKQEGNCKNGKSGTKGENASIWMKVQVSADDVPVRHPDPPSSPRLR